MKKRQAKKIMKANNRYTRILVFALTYPERIQSLSNSDLRFKLRYNQGKINEAKRRLKQIEYENN